jgi:hypothetical protein
MINSFHSSLRQFLLIPNRNIKFMDLNANCSTPGLNQFCWYLTNTWWSVTFFSSSIANWTLAARISVCLTSLTPRYIQQLREIVLPPSQNTVGICNQISLLILYYIYSRLVTLFKVSDATIQVPNIFDLTISFKFLYFSFQICLLFVPEMSASVTFYIIQIKYITLAWILYSLHFSLHPLI